MRQFRAGLIALGVVVMLAVPAGGQDRPAEPSNGPGWWIRASIIEACSCPMFCQCFFDSGPALHADHGNATEGVTGFCRFNTAIHIDEGSHNGVALTEARLWIAGDLGGAQKWSVLVFAPSVSADQRMALREILGHLYPTGWELREVEDSEIGWHATNAGARATLAEGKDGEINLRRQPGLAREEPVVIKNLPYWGAARHEGFILMPSTLEAYRRGERAFEFKNTNGFMLKLDMKSEDYTGRSMRMLRRGERNQ